MLRPRLYVVDEPLANLDPATAARLLATPPRPRRRGQRGRHRRAPRRGGARPPAGSGPLPRGRRDPVPRARSTGFLEVADPESVKLPFEVVLDRVARRVRRTRCATPTHDRPNAGPARPPSRARRGSSSAACTPAIGEHEILHGVDARLGPRETVAVLGPNGSRQDDAVPDRDAAASPSPAGAVLVDGASIADERTAELATIFGYVFQSPSQMLFARTVREELLFGPRNLGRDPATFDDLVDDVLCAGRRSPTSRTSANGRRSRCRSGSRSGSPWRSPSPSSRRTLILDEPSAGQDHRTAHRVHARGRRRSRGSKACTSSRTTWTLH